jgi:hypothetical protein
MKPKFPGFDKCMEMMRSRNPQTQEDGFHFLLPKASEHIRDFIAAFESEKAFGLRCWLLELIGAAKSNDAFGFLSGQLQSSEWQLRYWAIKGLKELDTKESRTLLWNARSWELGSAEATEEFRKQLGNLDS